MCGSPPPPHPHLYLGEQFVSMGVRRVFKGLCVGWVSSLRGYWIMKPLLNQWISPLMFHNIVAFLADSDVGGFFFGLPADKKMTWRLIINHESLPFILDLSH